MNLLELYNFIDDRITDCITDYREHKSSKILDSDVRDILTIYKKHGLFETFLFNFYKSTFDILLIVKLQLNDNKDMQSSQKVPIEFRYELNIEDADMNISKQSMYEKLEKMLEKAQEK